jgi:hypothetical protein
MFRDGAGGESMVGAGRARLGLASVSVSVCGREIGMGR